MLLDPLRRHFPDAGEAVVERRPIGQLARDRADLRSAALEIGRHGDIDLLGMRQAQIGHVAAEIAFAQLAAQARVEAALFGDAAGGQAAVVVGGIEQAAVRQGKDLVMDGSVEPARVALLEVGPAAAPDQQAVAGERHRAVVQNVGDAAAGVAGRRAHREMTLAEADMVVLGQQAVGALGTRSGGQQDATVETLLEQPGARDVVGVDMGLQGRHEVQAELLDQRAVTLTLLEHGIDHDRLLRLGAAEHIGVGRRLRVEELAEQDHRAATPIASRVSSNGS